MWETTFVNHQVEFKNFLLLIEIILTIFCSSSTVERGFSAVNRALTNSRLSMSKVTLDNIMILRINIPILKEIDPNYEVKLVDKAVSKYLEKLRYHHTSTKKKTTVVPRKSGTITSKDLFLPVPSSALPENNPLLADDNHFFPISDDNESDEEGHDKHNEDSDEGTEDEVVTDIERSSDHDMYSE